MTYLKRMIKPGDTILTRLSNISELGSFSHIKFFIKHDSVQVNITADVAAALNTSLAYHKDIKNGNGGMDAGYDLVHQLGEILYPQRKHPFKHRWVV